MLSSGSTLKRNSNMGPMEVVTNYALSFVGTPYRWGGDDFSGMDCSGFAQEILSAAGEDPPGDQTSQGLFDHFQAKGFLNPRKRAGALCFYGQSATKITHVAFALNDYQVIEAGGGGSRTKTEADAIRDNAYVRVRLINRRSDLVSIIRPMYTKLNLL